MPASITIGRLERLDDPTLGAALLRLQHAAYRVEADLIGDERIPPLHEDLPALLALPLAWLVASGKKGVLGALGYERTAPGWDIDRLVVDPDAFGLGTARALVTHLLALADGERVIVSTGRNNRPARRLYETSGFRPLGDTEVLPGLWVTDFERPGTST